MVLFGNTMLAPVETKAVVQLTSDDIWRWQHLTMACSNLSNLCLVPFIQRTVLCEKDMPCRSCTTPRKYAAWIQWLPLDWKLEHDITWNLPSPQCKCTSLTTLWFLFNGRHQKGLGKRLLDPSARIWLICCYSQR
jgi:hypothetical protein